MRKLILIIFIFIFIFANMAMGQKGPPADQPTIPQKADRTQPAPQKNYAPKKVITKTYFLNHLGPREVQRGLNYYFIRMTGFKSKKMITVQFVEGDHDIATFEKLLKKLDVPKRTIHFRIFTVIASQKSNGEKIENKDLNNVLKELKKLLNFKNFKLDGVSLLTLREGASDGRIQLSSSLEQLMVRMEDVDLNTSSKTPLVEIRELRLQHYGNTLIESETSIKENGYLVAGVSKIGKNGDALILIINAVIK